jgi:hypothetical protein
MATRITAAATGSRNRAGTKIPQLGNLPQDCGPLLFQLGERVGHKTSYAERIIYARQLGLKKRNLQLSTFMSRTLTKDKSYNFGGTARQYKMRVAA